MKGHDHWEAIYGAKAPHDVSWYRPHLDRSLKFIDQAGLSPDAEIIDVGAGASTLADDLLERGYRKVTVLDLSEAAIAHARSRLGNRADRVTWIVGDITRVELPEHRYDFWHDRAVFHFLVDADARGRYVAKVRHALKPGGHVVVATFGPEGPERCSGLPVSRYSPEGIHDQFGDQFIKIGSEAELHHTPWGSEQEFVYCYCRLQSNRTGDA
jgi:SAM-dependent methyltransferase